MTDTTRTSTDDSTTESLRIAQELADASFGDNPRTDTRLSMGALYDSKNASIAIMSFNQDGQLVRKDSIEQQLLPPPPSDIQVRVSTATNVQEPVVQNIEGDVVQRPNEQLIARLQRLDDQGSRIIELVSENRDQLAQITQLQQDLASKQEEMNQLQIQALNRLAQLRNNVQALLTQTYELHEYPIPRLFIVLPDD
ncbi:hypothetical protein BGX34_004155, partial [Mortierella sp. NVP85]